MGILRELGEVGSLDEELLLVRPPHLWPVKVAAVCERVQLRLRVLLRLGRGRGGGRDERRVGGEEEAGRRRDERLALDCATRRERGQRVSTSGRGTKGNGWCRDAVREAEEERKEGQATYICASSSPGSSRPSRKSQPLARRAASAWAVRAFAVSVRPPSSWTPARVIVAAALAVGGAARGMTTRRSAVGCSQRALLCWLCRCGHEPCSRRADGGGGGQRRVGGRAQ